MSISVNEFAEACHEVQIKWDNLSASDSVWHDVKSIEQYGTTFLRITRPLKVGAPQNPAPKRIIHSEDATYDAEEEAMSKHDPLPLIVTDIVHSSSYGVPVVYLSFRNLPLSCTLDVEEVQRILIPDIRRPQVSGVGVMGALSVTEHPVTGMTSYFVHPCRTSEAMASLRNHQPLLKPWEYLMMWFGVIGSSVGLDVPLEMALISNSKLGRDNLGP